MSGAAQGGASATKAASSAPNGQPAAASTKPAPQLEEDDEFEDFPVEDWGEEETQTHGDKTHLWEESWDDDDTSEDFAVQLREELKKLGK